MSQSRTTTLSIECCDARVPHCGNFLNVLSGQWSKQSCSGLSRGAPADKVYALTNAGARITESVIQDILVLLSGGFGIEAVRYVTHSDCGASKVESKLPVDRQLTAVEAARVEEMTMLRRTSGIDMLMRDDRFVDLLCTGEIKFRVAHWNIALQSGSWLFEFDHATRRMVAVPPSLAESEVHALPTDPAKCDVRALEGGGCA